MDLHSQKWLEQSISPTRSDDADAIDRSGSSHQSKSMDKSMHIDNYKTTISNISQTIGTNQKEKNEIKNIKILP